MTSITDNTININSTNNNNLNNIKTPSYQRYMGEFEGYACKFSPFIPNVIACAFSQYYGMVGNGRLSLFSQNPLTNILEETRRFNTNDGIFDIAWSEANENQILTGCGDGSLKLWDINLQQPLFSIKEHMGEVFGVSWNSKMTNIVASAGMDTTVKIYDAAKGVAIGNLVEHKKVVYSVNWHPTLENILASTSADQTTKLWDTKSGKTIKTIVAQNSEVMHMDFNKYENTFATAQADGSILLYDLRGTGDIPLSVLNGHKLTCRKVMFSPFFAGILASVGYDMNVIIWDIKKNEPVNIFKHHREFVYGLDFSLFDNKKIATTAWDRSLYTFNFDEMFKF
jgi:peroxin-7